MSIPEKYKVDHLFLLVGENPLPNYVAAHLLLNQPDGITYLVHTTGTQFQDTVTRLRNILESEGFKLPQLISLENYESDAYHIQQKLTGKIKPLSGKLGLNYTGGTKAMAVHSYRAFLTQTDTVFSYLDSRKLEMCIDNENGERIRFKIKPEILEIKLAKLFQIHGWAWNTEPTKAPKLPEGAIAFAQFHSHAELVTSWRDWCDEVLRKKARDPKNQNKWLKENKLQEISTLSLERLQDKTPIIEALACLKVIGQDLQLETIKNQGLSKIEHACKWLDGEWLEHYVLEQVQNISQKLSISDSASSFWIRNPSDPSQIKFEFDVAFMRGYQLFAISCTTIDYKGGCKQKLFEAYIRSQQLGGSEARVALVCCANPKDVRALETEIVNVLKNEPQGGEKDHKLAVFGREDLPNLKEKIADWIIANDKEAQ